MQPDELSDRPLLSNAVLPAPRKPARTVTWTGGSVSSEVERQLSDAVIRSPTHDKIRRR